MPTNLVKSLQSQPTQGGITPQLATGQGDTVLGASVPQSRDAVNILRTFGQGASLGFGDEAEAFVRSALPGGTSFQEELAAVRQEIKKFENENPGSAVGLEIAGALTSALLTRGGSARGPLGQRLIRSTLEGAGFGATFGAGKGEGFADRFQRAVTGGGFGAAFGLGGPLITELFKAGTRGVMAVVDAAKTAKAPQAEASRRVSGAIQRDLTTGEAGLTAREFAAARQSGAPVANVDIGGEATRAVARSAADTSPEGRAILGRLVDDRFESQSERISTFIGKMVADKPIKVGGAVIKPLPGSTVRDALESAARRANPKLYGTAFKAGDRSIRTPEIERLIGSNAMQAAIVRASKTGKDRAVADGFGAFNTKDAFKRGANDTLIFPNLQYWDAVKRELDDAASAAFRSGRKSQGGVLSELSLQLRTELDRVVPEYAKARGSAAQFFGAEDAFDAGKKFVRGPQGAREATKALKKMTEPERQLFSLGFSEQLIDTVRAVPDRANVVKRIYGSSAAKNKITLALGKEKSKEFEALMRIESVMDKAREATQGNSRTARFLADIGLAGGASGAVGLTTGDFSPQSLVSTALVVGLLRRGAQKVDQDVARRVAKLLASNDPVKITQGIKAVSKSQRLMTSLKDLSQRAVESSGGPIGGQLSGIEF